MQNQSALERFMLLLLGLNLKTGEDGILDFEHSAEIFGKGIHIIREIFGQQGETAGIHLKNLFNVSAPGFVKNLVFFGGPNINPAIVSINNLNLLKAHISEFNRHFSSYQVSVEESEVKDECLYAFNNIKTNAKFQWITEWIVSMRKSKAVGNQIVDNPDPIYPTIQIVDLSGYKYPNTNYYH